VLAPTSKYSVFFFALATIDVYTQVVAGILQLYSFSHTSVKGSRAIQIESAFSFLQTRDRK
jgi:hypothetical protein